ncbi:carnitine O-acetyltransferase-like [Scaptodrosophila lebanonensis]|uniref:Carnitine O-acetyltransferase-like n=1 Tax=Drosophila lebanonensis TaxID=7225 RepID=A0A6J2TN15_DROLE|nr:carnitine O-acetyltransferase-like [Scaptodrosophila lebanonensis]
MRFLLTSELFFNILKGPSRCYSKDKSADPKHPKDLNFQSTKTTQSVAVSSKIPADLVEKSPASKTLKAAESPKLTHELIKVNQPKASAKVAVREAVSNAQPNVKDSGKITQIPSDTGKQVSTENSKPAAIQESFKNPSNKIPLSTVSPNPKGAVEKKQKLLTYPVVPLDEILKRFLRTVKPLLRKKVFKEQEELTNQFEKNEGSELQRLLEEAGRLENNWLADRWKRVAYLENRAPLTIFTSPCMTFPMQYFQNKSKFLSFVAKVIYGMGEFKEIIDAQKLPVVQMDSFNLDNSQFCKVFGTVRKPRRFCDVLEQHAQSNHVVVIHNNHFYKISIYNDNGKLLHVDVLTELLTNIYNRKRTKGPSVGLLTHDQRDNWAETYALLSRNPKNLQVLKVIEQALFTVSLDRNVPATKEDQLNVLAQQLLHGGGLMENSSNRWMDKTLQLIVNPNGMAGFCFEHAPADCQPVAVMMDFIQKKLSDANYGTCGCKEHKDSNCVTPLNFAPPDKCISFWLTIAERNIENLLPQLQVHVFKFMSYGNNFIKAQGLNPDSFIQMALQLAFCRQHCQLPAQYESAHLRLFSGGRTETIRSTSMESRHFVQAMTKAKTSRNQRLKALRVAVDGHQEYTKLALQGRGVDRHLLGLRLMAREHGKPQPKFFKSEGFAKSMHFRICSSQVATNHEAFMAYGPAVRDGYGCCYNPRAADIIIAISAWRSNQKICATQYGKSIETALNEMGQLIMDNKEFLCIKK